MSDEWHLLRNKQKMGPFTWEELCCAARDGTVKRSDWVWNRALREWLQAGHVPGLFPYESSFAERPKQEYLARRRKKIWTAIIGLALVALVIAIALLQGAG